MTSKGDEMKTYTRITGAARKAAQKELDKITTYRVELLDKRGEVIYRCEQPLTEKVKLGSKIHLSSFVISLEEETEEHDK